jgi:GH24 family phage-related lysozyme (muramidase)
MSDHNSLKQLLIENEGRIPHMYLDTAGRVTVAVGHMIPAASEAQKLSLEVRGSGQAATAAEIAADFNQVRAQAQGMPAEDYRQFTALDMADGDIDQLLDQDIAGMETGVRQHLPAYNSYPEPAQDALLDMAFNLGMNGLVTNFPKLMAAAERKDWNTCAAECRRLGISDQRNQTTKNLFLQAAGA